MFQNFKRAKKSPPQPALRPVRFCAIQAFCCRRNHFVRAYSSKRGESRPQWPKTKKKNIRQDVLLLVRPAGFEPVAYRVGVCHSIQLSYGRMGYSKQKYYSREYPPCKEKICEKMKTFLNQRCFLRSESTNAMQAINKRRTARIAQFRKNTCGRIRMI